MDKKTLQTSIKSLLDQSKAIETAAGDKAMTPEQLKSYQEINAQAYAVKDQIDALDKVEALKGWAAESDGQSAVRAGFTSPEVGENGNAPGVTAEQVIVETSPNGRKSVSGGSLYGLDSLGEAKVKALKSGAYKDAFVDYLRNFKSPRGMKGASMKVLQEGVDESGGFWIPPEIRTELVRKIAVDTVIRQNAYVFTTGSDLPTFPKVTYGADDLFSSSVRAGWAFEAPASNMAETANPIAGRVQIPVNIATAAIYITRQQLEDNQFDILGYITQELAMAFGLLEESAFTVGDGAAKPQGILSHPLAQVASGTVGGGMSIFSGAAGVLSWGIAAAGAAPTAGIIGTEAALPPQYERNAKWFANKNTYAAIRALTDTATRPLWQLGDSYPNLSNGYSPALLGYPIIKDMFMPNMAATAWPLGLGDLQGYFIADRVGLSIEVLREVAALRDMVVVYARKRVGGQLVKEWMVKVMKSNNN